MASDSDNDAGTSVASDPGTHGPPCRIAAVATPQQRKPAPPRPHCILGMQMLLVNLTWARSGTRGNGVTDPMKGNGDKEEARQT